MYQGHWRKKKISRISFENVSQCNLFRTIFRLEWFSASEGVKFQRVMQEMSDVLTGKVKPPEPVKEEGAAEANSGNN